MTEIHLHGILGKKYGKVHKIALKKPRDVLFALEANYDDFLRDLKNLYQKNVCYAMIVDNELAEKNSTILNKKNVKRLDFVPIISGSGPAAIFMVIVSVATAYYNYVQAGKVEYPKIPGASSATTANNRSLAFSNRENVTEQGNPVPLVYGRMRVGAAVVQTSVKSFPLSITLSTEFQNTAYRNSGNQNAMIDTSTSEEELEAGE